MNRHESLLIRPLHLFSVFLSLLALYFILGETPNKDEIGTYCSAYDSGISREEMVQRYADIKHNGDIKAARRDSNIAIATKCPEHRDKLFSFDEIRQFRFSWED